MNRKNKLLFSLYSFVLCCALALMPCMASFATTAQERLDANKALPVSSNGITNWPTGPIVGAASAILIEAETGTVLYAKNIHDTHYPASTTKILTTLIAYEECSLDETVTFSHDAIFNTPRDSNHIAMDVGDTLSMETCLNAILIRSANEVAFAVAEHISGTSEEFAKKMNERAKELGCEDSNFVNPNGLPNENHYTSAYDLAKIGQAFFANDLLCNITMTQRLIVQKKNGELIENNKMELLPGHKYAYEYLVGCKTGYTEAARYALVSCAEKNGMKLICVVMQDENQAVYEDTIALFNYGFSNFDKVNVALQETKYNIDSQGLFYGENDLFGNSSPVLSLNKSDVIIKPKTVSLDACESTIEYTPQTFGKVAKINYSYKGVSLGSISVDYVSQTQKGYAFDNDDDEAPSVEAPKEEKRGVSFFFVNVLIILGVIIGIVVVLFAILFLYALSKRYHIHFPGKDRRAWKRARARRRNQIRNARRRSRRNYRERTRRR